MSDPPPPRTEPPAPKPPGERRTLDPRTQRRLTIGLAIATAVIGLWLLTRDDDPAPRVDAPQASPDAIVDATADPAFADVPESPGDPIAAEDLDAPAPDCEALARRATDGGPDAVLLAWLCPQRPLDAVTARAALLAVRSPDEAAALAPRLADHPTLAGLARLVAQTRVEPGIEALADPAEAVVSPIDDGVLAQVQRAHVLITTRDVALADRTRARALLAKVHLQATQQLGVGVGRPPGPFARLLIGRALHHGREFCVAYWRNRVSGLAPLFGEVETSLLTLVLALETSPHHGDAARLVVELDQARRYLLRDGPRDRIARRLAERSGRTAEIDALDPMANEVLRLVDHGLIDLAIARMLAFATEQGGSGSDAIVHVDAVGQMMRDALLQAERGEYLALLDRRFDRVRARLPAPGPEPAPEPAPEPEPDTTGEPAPEPEPPPLPPLDDAPGPTATEVAEDAVRWIERAHGRTGLARAHALGRALLLIRDRPDALVLVLDHASEGIATDLLPQGDGARTTAAAVRDAIPWLTAELAARDDGRRAWQARRVQAARALPGITDPDTARRRAFAQRVRRDDRLPRGPGLPDRTG